jgi:hypothetical protein
MKRILIAVAMVVLFATSAFAGGPSFGQQDVTTVNGAASLSASGVAGWGCSTAYANNTGSAMAFGNYATSTNTSRGFALGNAGFAAGGASAAINLKITAPKADNKHDNRPRR